MSDSLKMREMFIEQDEKSVATLGGKYLDNLLATGTISKDTCVVTNKRLYFRGKNYVSAKAQKVEFIVDLKDISNTGYMMQSNILLMIFAVLSVLGGIAIEVGTEEGYAFIGGIILALIFVFLYKITRKRFFQVFFPGGALVFSVNKYNINDIKNFHKNLRTAIANLSLDNEHKIDIKTMNAEEEDNNAQAQYNPQGQYAQYNAQQSQYNAQQPQYNPQQPQYNVQQPQYNVQQPQSNIQQSGNVQKEVPWKCPVCATINDPSSNFCVGCGKSK